MPSKIKYFQRSDFFPATRFHIKLLKWRMYWHYDCTFGLVFFWNTLNTVQCIFHTENLKNLEIECVKICYLFLTSVKMLFKQRNVKITLINFLCTSLPHNFMVRKTVDLFWIFLFYLFIHSLPDVWVNESERHQLKTKVVHLSKLPKDTALLLDPNIYR